MCYNFPTQLSLLMAVNEILLAFGVNLDLGGACS